MTFSAGGDALVGALDARADAELLRAAAIMRGAVERAAPVISTHLIDKFLWEAGVPGHEPPMASPPPTKCRVCREYACSPTTGACFNCHRDDPDERTEP